MSHQRFFLTLSILLVAVIVSACGLAAASTLTPEAQIPQITIKATDFAFEVPAQVPAGLVSVTLVNDGKEPHHAQFLRLNDGVTLEQFQAALQQDPEAIIPLITAAGGPGVVDPGQNQQVTVELTAGQYVLLCFVSGHDDMPHLAKGMMAAMEVVAGDDQPDAPEIKADATVKLVDFSFSLPSQIKAGQQVWKVINEGTQVHEFALIKVSADKSLEDVAAFMQSPHGVPPFEAAGGFQAIDPGDSGWLTLDFQPGQYVALCHVPDSATGYTHIELGMVVPFSVK